MANLPTLHSRFPCFLVFMDLFAFLKNLSLSRWRRPDGGSDRQNRVLDNCRIPRNYLEIHLRISAIHYHSLTFRKSQDEILFSTNSKSIWQFKCFIQIKRQICYKSVFGIWRSNQSFCTVRFKRTFSDKQTRCERNGWAVEAGPWNKTNSKIKINSTAIPTKMKRNPFKINTRSELWTAVYRDVGCVSCLLSRCRAGPPEGRGEGGSCRGPASPLHLSPATARPDRTITIHPALVKAAKSQHRTKPNQTLLIFAMDGLLEWWMSAHENGAQCSGGSGVAGRGLVNIITVLIPQIKG